MVVKKKMKTFPLVMKMEYTGLNLGKTVQKVLAFKKHNLFKEIKTKVAWQNLKNLKNILVKAHHGT
jgi:hypothetical protein